MQKGKTILLVDDDVEHHKIFPLGSARVDALASFMTASDGIATLAKSNENGFQPDYISSPICSHERKAMLEKASVEKASDRYSGDN